MAKAKKRPTKSPARTKAVAKKSAAAKKTAAKRVPIPKKTAVKKAAPQSKPLPAKKTAAHTSMPAPPTSKSVERATVKPQRPVAPAPKPTVAQENLSPDSKKKLAAQHMWDLVQAKKQRAAQTPTWKAIVHHDHPAPRTSPDLSSDQSGSSPPTQMPGHRNRGTD